MKQVKSPRAGRVYNHHVAIVYSKHYQMSMGGIEKLHSFDIRKYARIYLKLNTSGLLRPEDVFVPEAVSEDQILLVHTRKFLDSLKDSPTVARYLEAAPVAIVPNALVDAAILNALRYSTGGTILASRLGYRINHRFVRRFFGRVFDNPTKVFDESLILQEMLNPGGEAPAAPVR